jgi:hypothetical protein
MRMFRAGGGIAAPGPRATFACLTDPDHGPETDPDGPGRNPTQPPVRTGWLIGRVLFAGRLSTIRLATIHLRSPLPVSSCDLPTSSGGPPSSARCLVLLRVGFA